MHVNKLLLFRIFKKYGSAALLTTAKQQPEFNLFRNFRSMGAR